jgi:hypothetical protein
MNFDKLSIQQLIAFYNRHAAKPVKRFSDSKTAIRRCTELFNSLRTNEPVKVMKQEAGRNTRPTMQTSLRLDRTITCVETGEVWRNAYQMWLANPNWMTSGQQDRLTAQLYSAAKRGEKIMITINNRTFHLVNV